MASFCVAMPARLVCRRMLPQTREEATLNKVPDGFVRLDTQTGEVALCSQRAVGWACQAAPEDRAAFESEIARLRSENATLKQAMLSHGLALPSGVAPEPSDAGSNDITIRLPDNADIDRAVAYVGRVWRRFVEVVVRAQKQMLNKG
jgi:predicted PhzF superfamily epimerase YddE/YHI9